ncbi:hypothetical protein [Robertmurraya siralis]|uniref:hypothetical protein n=1 Tax=Robertmurraya siralis TaxID=77777 RepID=UPI0010F4A2BB|nr:hypothetical protein [Robertmurraya siralis]
MEVLVSYIYNQTRNSSIEQSSEIMYFDEYSYEEIMNDIEKENEFMKVASDILKSKYGYSSIKITTFSEL